MHASNGRMGTNGTLDYMVRAGKQPYDTVTKEKDFVNLITN